MNIISVVRVRLAVRIPRLPVTGLRPTAVTAQTGSP